MDSKDVLIRIPHGLAPSSGISIARIDAAVRDRAPAMLADMARRELPGLDSLTQSPTTLGLALQHDGQLVALINATTIKLTAPTLTVHGAFLQDSQAWLRVRREIQRRIRTRVTPAPSGPSLDEDSFPDPIVLVDPADIDDATRRSMVDATARLRQRRDIVFGLPVRVRDTRAASTFAPPRVRGQALEVPFTYMEARTSVTGALRLKAPGPVLAAVISSVTVGDPGPAARRAWAFALIAYAELVCSLPAAPSTAREAPSSMPGRIRTGARRAPQPRNVVASPTSFGNLEPTAATRVLLASYVVGHRRRLTPGRTAGDQARRNAQRWGISLQPGYTWVEPHMRGQPNAAVLEFEWTNGRLL